MLDISGRVINYDSALCEHLSSSTPDELYYSTPFQEKGQFSFKTINLLSLIPLKYQNSDASWKRFVKALEGLLNYLYIGIWLLIKKFGVLHFQWLPFLEVVGIEYYILKLYRLLSPHTKFILTIHNLYPHDMSEASKVSYNSRFRKVATLFDKFIVHTNISKLDVLREFGIQEEKIEVVHHGVFVPKDFTPTNKGIGADGRWNIIMYGNQSEYKGTDVFVKALSLLPLSLQSRVRATICGKISPDFLHELKEIETHIPISWMPSFIEDEELYRMIDNSDMIVLPYRVISQSGVLLLALNFRRVIVTSDLPSFRETLYPFPSEQFFENENPQSLAKLICKYVNGEIDVANYIDEIERLNKIYSWEEAAKNTYRIYVSSELIDVKYSCRSDRVNS